MARRGTDDPSSLGIYQNWAWSWPANRRVLYNRASCDLEGKPWDPSRKQVWWNEGAQKWVGNDVPDFKPDSHPKDHMGPFIMNPEGIGRLFGPLAAFQDGPFPSGQFLLANQANQELFARAMKDAPHHIAEQPF